MAAPYIPTPDAQFSLWAQAFAGGISANPSLYMLTPAQADSIQGVVDLFVAALYRAAEVREIPNHLFEAE
jgi:hypothetical protein